MKHLRIFPALFLALLIGATACSNNADLTDLIRRTKQGDADAQHRLLTAVIVGSIKREAKLGDAEAQYKLGTMYFSGEGVAQDYKEALKLFRLAAVQGYAEAQVELGLMYDAGKGVPRDYVLAHMWLDLAFDSGFRRQVVGNNYLGKPLTPQRMKKLLVKSIDYLEKKMTPQQIEKAKELSRECKAKNYKDC